MPEPYEYLVQVKVTVKVQAENGTWASNKAIQEIASALADHKVSKVYDAAVSSIGALFLRDMPVAGPSREGREAAP